jgi:hypothetical protein
MGRKGLEDWIASRGLEPYLEALRREGVDSDSAVELTDLDLERLGSRKVIFRGLCYQGSCVDDITSAKHTRAH